MAWLLPESPIKSRERRRTRVPVGAVAQRCACSVAVGREVPAGNPWRGVRGERPVSPKGHHVQL